MSGARWPAATLQVEWRKPIEGSVCAAMWPTYQLATREHWFDELYVWTEGFQASTMQRARIQLNSLRKGFALLSQERVRRVGVTLSFGTVERCLDLVTDTFDEHRLLSHRVVVLLRGQIDRMRSPYRVRGFVDWLRSLQVPVGYRLAAPRISMEMKATDFVQPDFAKVDAPTSGRVDFWRDVLLEARSASLNPDWLIVSGLETEGQLALARDAGFGFGQGTVLKPPYDPPSTRRPRSVDSDVDALTEGEDDLNRQ
jgi:hypothetical protein